ncbi:RNA polymerase sigma factor [Occallatibacter savannae]|uniref:RNA polymerase sigma factor n=1 Tax=Occallatibacter savannae TaxID=1002691 RepID=UPI000D686B59|nr:RNA polymerase sigma factor [Occallatibacter savannae]
MSVTETHRAIEAVWRIEAAKVIAGLTRIVRDLDLAEDLAQEALLIALERWPDEGIPPKPGAWLMKTAKHRALDHFRKVDLNSRKHEELARELGELERTPPDLVTAVDDPIGDDVLRLIFISCHPVLSMESRAALTLRVVGGLTTDEIARAFLTPEPTIAQRIVRAKKTLGQKNIPFEVPRGLDLAARLSSVLEVLYLIFNEGYSATSGEELIRASLCDEALRLGRILAELDPREPEVHGLVALMEIQASRSRARVNADGNVVLLMEQNRALWDQLLIRRGLAALERANALTSRRGPYHLQAELAACHARAVTAEATDWGRIVGLYDELARVTPSPIVELNRVVAVGFLEGPAKALELLGPLAEEPALRSYHLLPSVRGDLLARLGRVEEAAREFERAAAMTRNERERTFLLERARNARGTSPDEDTI